MPYWTSLWHATTHLWCQLVFFSKKEKKLVVLLQVIQFASWRYLCSSSDYKQVWVQLWGASGLLVKVLTLETQHCGFEHQLRNEGLMKLQVTHFQWCTLVLNGSVSVLQHVDFYCFNRGHELTYLLSLSLICNYDTVRDCKQSTPRAPDRIFSRKEIS